MLCEAKSKRSGEPCKNHAVGGAVVCRMHGATAGAPAGNANAVTHGAYETLMRETLPEVHRAAFDAVPVGVGLDAELRILRFKLLRLLPDNVEQNMAVGFDMRRIKADEPTKTAAIAHLVGEIRKVVKDMKDQGGVDDPLAALVRDWEEGMRAEGSIGDANRPQPETA